STTTWSSRGTSSATSAWPSCPAPPSSPRKRRDGASSASASRSGTRPWTPVWSGWRRCPGADPPALETPRELVERERPPVGHGGVADGALPLRAGVTAREAHDVRAEAAGGSVPELHRAPEQPGEVARRLSAV